MRRLVLAGILAALIATPAAADPTPIVQRHEKLAGRSLAQWEVAWTRWLFTFTSTALETETECLAQPHPGPVRFLMRSLAEDHVTTVTCTIPAGTYLMLGEPVVYCTDIDADPAYPTTAKGLRRCARDAWREFTDPHPRLVLDGQPIPSGFVVRPPAFRFSQPGRDNDFDKPGVTRGRAALVGRAAIVRPLAPGVHTLIEGVRYTDDSNSVTVYKLTVV